jgi:hypothetical protein
MRSRFRTALVLMAIVGLAPAAHASDERHGPGVGSLRPETAPRLMESQESAGDAAKPKADPLSNGVGIGIGIGAGAGLVFVAKAYAGCDGNCDGPESLGVFAMGAGVGAAIGAVVGLIVDASLKSTNQRVSVGGVVTPKRSQVGVTVRF